MENYKEKYEQAMLRMNKWVEGSEIIEPKEVAEFVFPELKESKDERIRKELLDYLEERRVVETLTDTRVKEEWIAWLEKQSEPQVRTGSEWVKTIDAACEHRYAEEYAHGEHCHQQSFRWGFQEGVDWLEKQGVQKFVDKCKDCNNVKGCITCTDGDQYAHITEQKPTWSEEDEIRAAQIISDLEKCTVPGFPVYIGGVELEINWLKSLKERYTWKPSESDILLLERIANGKSNPQDIQASLGGLIGQLKKLMEE